MLRMWCKECSQLICASCGYAKHRWHNVGFVEEVYATTQQELEEFMKIGPTLEVETVENAQAFKNGISTLEEVQFILIHLL